MPGLLQDDLGTAAMCRAVFPPTFALACNIIIMIIIQSYLPTVASLISIWLFLRDLQLVLPKHYQFNLLGLRGTNFGDKNMSKDPSILSKDQTGTFHKCIIVMSLHQYTTILAFEGFDVQKVTFHINEAA